MIKIYMMNVGVIDPEDEKWYKNLSDRRLEKIGRLKNNSAKRRSIAAEILLNIGMDKEIQGVDHPVVWDTDDMGKPYLTDYPDIHMNITHSKDYAVCVISDKPVGVDIQYMREVDLKIAERWFTKSEQEYIKDSKNPKDAFYEIWVRKESFVKAVGAGLNMSLDSFSVLSDVVMNGNERYELTMQKTADSEYKMCVCVKLQGQP